MARFKDIKRVVSPDKRCLLTFSGDHPDFQEVRHMFKRLHEEDELVGDELHHTPREIWSYLSRVMYKKRTDLEPFWDVFAVGGLEDDKRLFLGIVDLYGTHFEADYYASGIGHDLCMPILREHWRSDMNRDEAVHLAEVCLTVLAKRSCRSVSEVLMGCVTEEGVEIGTPYRLQPDFTAARPGLA